MEKQTIQVNFAPGQTTAELIVREGAAAKQLEPKEPIPVSITGTIGAPYEFLSKRIDKEQFRQSDCNIIVDRENVQITLVINESDAYMRGVVAGKLLYNPKFLQFGINVSKAWKPTELGLFIKMNRSLFANRNENMELVSRLMNFTATVNNSIERAVKENGNRTDNFAQVVNSNLPESFTVRMPIFKGMSPETIEVETFAHVDGHEVSFFLLSPGAQAVLEDLRDHVIDGQLERIREIAPDIVIIEV